MRLDKFLKLTRLVKRRTLAAALCQKGRVSLNGKVAKASTAVQIGQTVTLKLGPRLLEAKILGLPTRALGNHTDTLTYLHYLNAELNAETAELDEAAEAELEKTLL